MTVSVVMATFNGEKFVAEQLDSLRSQTYPVDEVVIIDDCSTDSTAEIVRNYIKEHDLSWQFSVAEKNSGYKRNFYNCLAKASGDIVFLCDQDDIWYENKIEKMLSVFKNHPECLAVNSSFDIVGKQGEMLQRFEADNGKASNHGLIGVPIAENGVYNVDVITVAMSNVSPGCTAAFKKDIVSEYLKASECKIPHDWELNLIAANRNGLAFYNQPLIGYRIHGNNTIGLDLQSSVVPAGVFKMRGNDSVRFANFVIQKNQSELISKYCNPEVKTQKKLADGLKRFCRNREKILYGKRLLPAVANIFVYPKVKQLSTVYFRGVLGDIAFALKGKLHKGDTHDRASN